LVPLIKLLMDNRKKKRLRSAGWKTGNAMDFLGLKRTELAFIELKLGLANAIREGRYRRKITQEQLGRFLGSSQSRVAKMEAADRSVSLDLMVRSLLRMGETPSDVASHISATSNPKRAA